MQFSVVFDHNVNTEEIAAHGIDPKAWESMFLDYLRANLIFDPVVTTVESVTLVGQPPVSPTPGLVY